MRFDIITIFPEFFSGPFDHGILRRMIAIERWTTDPLAGAREWC
jgi:tRNA G37 N-methylase TrmD